MAVALTDVRFVIQDEPRSFGVSPESPRVIGSTDGETTLFYLPLDSLQYVAGSAALYSTPSSGGSPTGISSALYSISQQGVVTFASAPASGSVLTASFQATSFADADLTNVLTRNQNQYGTAGDPSVLAGCQLDCINIWLANPNKLAALRQAEWEKNPAAVISALKDLRASLLTIIEGGVRPGRTVPALTTAGPRTRQYQPGR